MEKQTTKNLILSALFVALIAVGAFIRIPLPAVPFTLQYPMTMLAGLLLGGKRGCLAVCAYIVLGLMGLPIFASGSSGVGYALQPSFGYILGFALGALLTGSIARGTPNPSWKRLLAAAALGGLYGVICLLPPTAAANSVIFQMLVAAALIWVAFGPTSFFLRQLLLFWLLSCTMGGILLAADNLFQGGISWEALSKLNWKVFFLVGGTCYFLLSVIFRGSARHELRGDLCRCTVTFRGREVSFTALLDTGHTLTDGATGDAVLIVEAAALGVLWTESEKALLAQLSVKGALWCLEQLAADFRFRLLPYQAVGVSTGLLLCFRADKALIDGQEYRHLTVAISPTPVSDGGGYCALWGGREGRCNDAA